MTNNIHISIFLFEVMVQQKLDIYYLSQLNMYVTFKVGI